MTWPLLVVLVTAATALLMAILVGTQLERERRKRHALHIDMLAHVESLSRQNADTMVVVADIVHALNRVVK